ncbi:UNVERIFIED_CONTAM: hypothetical protein Sradi_7196300 [Sesamum radiatum]|uniref:Reverse transcriptase n=1 Tax=Sesamum radiatum TaxID=300843 RepID=A0AAW2IQ57_SESRA
MGFQEAVLPIKYLGVPLIASRLTVADCQPLIDRFNSRLAGGASSLSFAGRLQLLKSVLSSLHMYWASVFILPKAVIKALMLRHIWRSFNVTRDQFGWLGFSDIACEIRPLDKLCYFCAVVLAEIAQVMPTVKRGARLQGG